MRVHDALTLPSLASARAVGEGDRTREVVLAHVVDVPETPRWVTPGTFLLSTGLSWPREPAALGAFATELAACAPAAVVLAAPHFFPAFPAEAAAALAARGIPTLELPYEVPFAQVVQEVHGHILREQADVLRRSERIHRALTRAALSGNLADVAQTLADGLGRGAVVLSAAGLPLTPGPAPGQADVLAALARPGNAPRDLAGGTLVPVILRGGREGGVWVQRAPDATARRSGPDRAPPDLAVRAAEHAATVVALLLLAQRDAEVREARLGYAFVDSLLEGRFTNDPAAQERAARLGFDPAGEYSVGLLALHAPLPLTAEGFAGRERAAQQVREVLASLGAAPLVSVNLNTVWFLLPARISAERVWARLGWAGPDAPGGMVYSRARTGVDAVGHSRAEALTLATHARPGQLRSYAEVLVPRALSGDRDAQGDLTRSLLGPLRSSRGADGLIATIRTLSETGFSQVETAARLGIHANTLRYRMERIETLTARSLGQPDTRALWWLALQLDALQP
ncbi:PucR family transcriptional regulator [Deinococcus sp. KSM4-11]|uniref:helix-turn-helix domain-containing protein n=1 Tax=Deinococcus sp. KSM4-11 TaxID=2568654 RepID=UPI0010A2BD7F|nr:PucR family transcriptional regulator ligand-binding domain-containing protein [Deinococcus sp. KSM4-11]THF86167.1 PucR family transcriptional regulator [Deinococcus sp. KSM4-11]